MRIRKPDGRVRRVVLGNTNSQTLRERIATAMMGGTAAFVSASALTVYTDANPVLDTTLPLITALTGGPSRSGAVVTLATQTFTSVARTSGTVRAAIIRLPNGGAQLSSVTGLSEVIAVGDRVTLSWQWTFSGLVASANTNAALLAAGGTSSWDWTDTRAQYSISSSAATYRTFRGEPSRVGATIEYETPNAVLSNSSNLTVYFWRVVRNATGSTEVVSRQALNRVVEAGARAVGTWDINIV